MTMPETTSGPSPTLVIIPAFNEEEALPSVLRDLLSRPGLDVIVVDDGSTDRTAAVAADHGATVLSLPFNLGIGGALRTGFLYAVRNGYDRAVQFDGDGQHLADEIPALLGPLAEGSDMVVGSRFAGEATSYTVGRVRARAMGILRFAIKTLSGQQFSDTSSGFRAFNRDVLEFFARTYPSEYMESVEALLLACAEGFKVTEVPVHMTEREAGTPSNRRLRLVYHYLRLLVVLVASAPRRAVVREARS
jgi:glycosyltransferase involved in cell wall biosynthesis